MSEEELEFLLMDSLEEMATEFQLRWEPKSGQLRNLLDAYTKDQLLEFCKKNRIAAKASWKKGEICDALMAGILDTLKERVLLWDEERFEILVNFVENGFEFETAGQEMLFFMTVLPDGINLGLLFVYDEGDQLSAYAPSELKAFIANLGEMKNDKAVQRRLDFAHKIEEVLIASIHLYGAITHNRLMELWDIKYPNEKKTMDFYSHFYKILPILIIQNNYSIVENSLIVSQALETEEDALDLYTETINKMGTNYYRPSAGEITYYGNHSFDRRTKPYKNIFRAVKAVANNPDLVMHLLERSIVLGEGLGDVLDELEEIGVISFYLDNDIDRFVETYSSLNNHTRLWQNAGYTPKELGQDAAVDGIPGFYSAPAEKPQQPIIKVEKIGRNDPCPCGSGKKYKKCCMRK